MDILFLLFPPSVVALGFRSFEGEVFIVSLPNLVWLFIGLIACTGYLSNVTRGNFLKFFLYPKNGGHFEFSNVCRICKNTNLLLSP